MFGALSVFLPVVGVCVCVFGSLFLCCSLSGFVCMLGLAWFGCLAGCWVGCLFGSLVAWLAGWALFLWFFSLFCWVGWLGLSVWLAG